MIFCVFLVLYLESSISINFNGKDAQHGVQCTHSKVWKTLEQSYGKEELESKKEQASKGGQKKHTLMYFSFCLISKVIFFCSAGRLYQRTTSMGALSEASSMPAASAFRWTRYCPVVALTGHVHVFNLNSHPYPFSSSSVTCSA